VPPTLLFTVSLCPTVNRISRQSSTSAFVSSRKRPISYTVSGWGSRHPIVFSRSSSCLELRHRLFDLSPLPKSCVNQQISPPGTVSSSQRTSRRLRPALHIKFAVNGERQQIVETSNSNNNCSILSINHRAKHRGKLMRSWVHIISCKVYSQSSQKRRSLNYLLRGSH